MNRFVVVLPPDSNITAKSVSGHFPNNHPVIPDRVWVVAGQQRTCADVCEALGIGETEESDGLVVKIHEYYGFTDKALWERLGEWKSEKDGE